MRYMVLILNMVYWFLTSVKNPSPFLGAVILVTLLIGVSLRNLLLTFYAFKPEPMITNNGRDFLILGVVFILMYWFSTKKRDQIEAARVEATKLQSWVIALLFISTLVAFILLANVNREKIFNQVDSNSLNKLQKESLEAKIRKWFK
ncbi:hypothetical protein [Lunatimonas salinarum]|uniref:hypothetical protein n=1 Tax=Lunatimonas salinarum TaxID=1774590 RepID=UPI001AE0CCEC|nr:hypothetical protein [Lunatimonas salinarum]